MLQTVRWTFLLSLLLALGCGQTTEKPATDMASAEQDKSRKEGPARYLALGDSYTIGEAVASDQRWPVMLVKRLRKAGIEIRQPRIIAKTGWTTGELLEAVEAAKIEPGYELVTLLIGVNNQYRSNEVPEYRGEFEELLEQAVRFAAGEPERVIVISIPDWGVTPFARKDERSRETIAEQIDAFNAVNRTITEQHGAHYVDVTDISREVADDILLVANDGLHPSAQQYQRWTDRILPVARDILGGR